MYKYNPRGGYWKNSLSEQDDFIDFISNVLDIGKEIQEEFFNKESIQKLIEANQWVKVFEEFRNTRFTNSTHLVNLVLAHILSFADIDFMKYIPDDKVKELLCYDYAGKYIKGSEDMIDWYE